VGIVGVGNCASSLVQGIEKYREINSSDPPPPGVMHVDIAGYGIGDIEVVAAFDVHAGKVGTDIAHAIKVPPNNTRVFQKVEQKGVVVQSGPVLDGIGKWVVDCVPLTGSPPVDVAAELKRAGVQVLVNYLPVGSEMAARFYAGEALKAGCALINCMPVFIATDAEWVTRFARANLPIIGDDIKSQVGATIVHRVLAGLFGQRGVRIDRTYQMNFGGNTDFLNMLERERLQSKKISKTQAVTSQMREQLSPENIHVGPSDYVAWLEDRKWAHIRIEGTTFGDTPLNLELKLEVWDSPNSAGVVVDAIRCARLALDRGIGGALEGPSSYFMKSPPVQHEDHEAERRMQAFIDNVPVD